MPIDHDAHEQDGAGLSRRQVLARGAVAAGVVWAAPVIRTASAYATSAAGTERPCTNFYLVCIDPLGTRPVRFASGESHYDDESAVDAAIAASTTTTTSSTTTTSTSTTTTTTTTTAPPAPTAPTSPATADATGSDATPPPTDATTTTTTAPAADDFGLFPDTATTTPETPPATLPPDPEALAFAAAAGAAAAGAPDNLPPGIKSWLKENSDVPVRYPGVLPMLTQTSAEAWSVVIAPVTGPDPLTHQCRAVRGWAQVRGKYAEFYVDPDPAAADEAGRRLVFPNPRVDELSANPLSLIENIIFVYCCPQ